MAQNTMQVKSKRANYALSTHSEGWIKIEWYSRHEEADVFTGPVRASDLTVDHVEHEDEEGLALIRAALA